MTITLNKEQFEAAIYTAMEATGNVFEGVTDYLQNAEDWLKYELFGIPLIEQFASLPAEEQRILRSLVSLRAFDEAIPYLDLVLTPNGFGIVNSDKVAPASKERVSALRTQVKKSLDEQVERFMIAIYTHAESWALFAQGNTINRMIDSLIFTSNPLRIYAGMADATRSTLLQNRPKIRQAEVWISKYISADYLEELIEGSRARSEVGREMRSRLRKIIGLLLNDNLPAAERLIYRVVNDMEADIIHYPTYKKSVEYELKHSRRYENKKEDTTFFFG